MTTKGFYEYSDEELNAETTFDQLPEGTYHLRVRDFEVSSWSDGRPRLEIMTEVVSGSQASRYGPRHTWTLGDYDGTTKDGREFHIDGEAEQKKLVREVTRVRNGKTITITNPSQYDSAMLQEIGEQIKGDEFIGVVALKNGYPRIQSRGIHSMASPPKSFTSAEKVSNFSLENV